MASVQGFRQYFRVEQVNAFCVLPLYHVSGLMQFMRSFTSGGRLVLQSFKALEAAAGSDVDPVDFFLSLVPTQLQRLLETNATAWLYRCQTVLLGGSPAWPQLLAAARAHGIRLAPTYGMTETASQIVTLKPETFLAGNSSCGQLLPHAQVTICSPTGEILGANQTGAITIRSQSLALGYYAILRPTLWAGQWLGDDLGFLDAQGYLTVVGRRSNKIITGGENVFPAEVEAILRATNLVKDVCVIGVPDQDWGEVVTAVYVPDEPLSLEVLQAALEDHLSKFKRPKYWISVPELPRNPQGKINREQLQQMILAWQQATDRLDH
jgi:O-succinylbenzoic acid--CoA ligase